MRSIGLSKISISQVSNREGNVFLLDFLILFPVFPCPTSLPSISLNNHSTSTNTSTVILVNGSMPPSKALICIQLKGSSRAFLAETRKSIADVFDSLKKKKKKVGKT